MALFVEADFGLGRVNVGVHLGRIDLDEEREQRMAASRHHIAVGGANGADHELVANGAAVDEQELLGGVGAMQRGQAGVPRAR